MIPVATAKEIIAQHCAALQPEKMLLLQAAGKVLAEDIFGTTDIPGYAQSSMDGYAFNFAGYTPGTPLKIVGEMAAGTATPMNIAAGQAVRIFTGAPLPEGADTVIMQEKVAVENNQFVIKDDSLRMGASVRGKGAEIKNGCLALNKNTVLTPGALGFLAGTGVTDVLVYPAPKVCIIVTGNELQQPGKELMYGQVYESNSIALSAALAAVGVNNIHILYAADDLNELSDVLRNAIAQADLILLTGGVSVGDYDFVLQAAENCGVEKLFHKIKQKPGKPLYLGKKDNKIIFGLPGNPSSVLTCFYQYVLVALSSLMKKTVTLQTLKVPLGGPLNKPGGLTHFFKAMYDGSVTTPLSAQESFRMSSFATANCLIEVDADSTSIAKDEPITIHILPA